MSIFGVNRRQFLTLPLGMLLAARGRAQGAVVERRAVYSVEVGLMYDLVNLRLTGTIRETVDRKAGRYEVEIRGEGDGIANRAEARGALREGRWAPLHATSWVSVQGRESRTEVAHDHARRTVHYRARGETFFLRRRRVVDDVVRVPRGVRVDDAVSASLNYADGYWLPAADGRLRTHVVRRQRASHEGPDDVAATYRADLVPLELRVVIDPATGRETGLLDLTAFSSWARESEPARVVFGPGRRPRLITTEMIFGTSFTVRLGET